MIVGESARDDPPEGPERAEEVFLEADPVTALVSAFDALLGRHGLELVYLTHREVAIAYLDIVPRGLNLSTVELPEGALVDTLERLPTE